MLFPLFVFVLVPLFVVIVILSILLLFVFVFVPLSVVVVLLSILLLFVFVFVFSVGRGGRGGGGVGVNLGSNGGREGGEYESIKGLARAHRKRHAALRAVFCGEGEKVESKYYMKQNKFMTSGHKVMT